MFGKTIWGNEIISNTGINLRLAADQLAMEMDWEWI
jgi:hypothetical protein